MLVVAGVFLYAYIQVKREAEKEATQQADLEGWLEYYTVGNTNKTWHRVREPETAGHSVPFFACEYNRSTPDGGGERKSGEYTEIKKPL